MEIFRSSIDWHHELQRSLLWVCSAWLISAVCVLLAAALITRTTTWGRQFWLVTGGYFTGRASVRVWSVAALLLLLVMVEVRLDVLQSYYSNDLYSSLQVAFQGAAAHHDRVRDSGVQGFWMAMVIFCVLAILKLARILADIYITQGFIIRWRVWLTARLTTDWLAGRAYYRDRFTAVPVDNPDQRIQQDIDVFTTGVGTGPNIPSYYATSMLWFGAVRSVVSVASFAVILWHLSGSLTIFGVSIPKALFWTVLGYVAVASAVAFRIGHPLIRLSFDNEKTNAVFRYALIRLRGNAESVALYRGERAERVELDGRFAAVIGNYRRYVRRTIGLMGWNFTITQAILPLPFVLQAPRLFSGTIRLGDVTQSATAFGKIESGLSFFRNAYTQFASYNAAVIRLHGLVEANTAARELPELPRQDSADGAIHLDDVDVTDPAGRHLIEKLNLHMHSGDSVVITGPSGSGKTTLLRSLAGLWPSVAGRWSAPSVESTMFIPQLPYLPSGSLRAVVSYPVVAGEFSADALRGVLDRVALGQLRDDLDSERDWAAVLSPGEQQRIAFARILLMRPQLVLLDEATSALDEGLECAMYELLRGELPGAVIISVGHHHTIERYHRKQLKLCGDGSWQLKGLS